ncbi:MAG TPA: protein kinase [Kofleriaceae bacterium]|jgi:serine/threonine-protein kinase|nr:protein kinase [Kofleriaceae bacterium]
MVLGSYRILHELNSGGMGTVFRAEHVLLGRPAAVKLLRRELSTSPALVQRFVNEARAVTACKHPGIVEAYDFGYTEDGHAFIVMELLDGESLGRRLARGRLAELEAAAIAHGIASALRAAHRVGVIHRDLKPDNVFLVPDPDGGIDRTKVLDFGIAKLTDGAPEGGYTQTGALIGTPLYMAPEQARAAAAIDPRADLYSLGCILYHMLTGRPPFVAEGAGEIIALQMFGEVVPPGQLAPVTPEMERLVLRLLDKDPAQRPGSAGELASALDRLGRQPTRQMTRASPVVPDPGATGPGIPVEPADLAAGSSAVPLPDPRTTVRVPRRSALPLVAGVVCGIAIAAAGVIYATQGEPAASAPASLIKPAPPAPAATNPSAPAATNPAPPAPPSVAPAAPGPATSPAAAPDPPAAPDGQAPRKHPAHKIARGVGSITPPAGRILPEQSVEVHRGNRQPDPPSTGDHSPGGAPLEDTVDLDRKSTPRGSAPRAPPLSPPRSPPPSPKDPRSP